jgi:hypothetical protein
MSAAWAQLKRNHRYFPNGHLREDLRKMYAAEWLPKLKAEITALDELRRELGI